MGRWGSAVRINKVMENLCGSFSNSTKRKYMKLQWAIFILQWLLVVAIAQTQLTISVWGVKNATVELISILGDLMFMGNAMACRVKNQFFLQKQFHFSVLIITKSTKLLREDPVQLRLPPRTKYTNGDLLGVKACSLRNYLIYQWNAFPLRLVWSSICFFSKTDLCTCQVP